MDVSSTMYRPTFIALAVALPVGSLIAAIAAGPAWPLPVFATQLDGLDNRFLGFLFLGVAVAMAIARTAESPLAVCKRRVRSGLMLAYALSTALFGGLALLAMAVLEVAVSALLPGEVRESAS